MPSLPSFDPTHLIESMPDGVYLSDASRSITFWNKAAERITGFTAAEVVGKNCSDNILTHIDASGNNLCKGMCPLARCIKDDKPYEAEVFLHHKSGYRIPVLVRVSPLHDESGKVTGGMELFTDISNKAALQERIAELEQLALVDNLTKVSNRHHTLPSLDAIFMEKERYDLSFGVMMIDIDDFKTINDTKGHEVGDAVLVMVAGTLRNALRPYDHLGRWGGEEFLAIVRNVDAGALLSLANRCRLLIEQSYLTRGDAVLRVTVSVGATVATPEDNGKSIVERADKLQYASKNAGKNRVTMG
ncbi:MAG TPA: sensor domain-containing diguanylate cyclase [Chitinivibrionales bacterium]|nr:sensor domain-containing diguanylate cyclase [Chitinivibrionales bacterium]